ncbi:MULTISPECIES: fumarylacetoacetase [Ramlibacter]|uniref:fumarylacetoacetase n=1 Tax=Ramlibacter pinisoli TaxID=2682844 RepID=A0A6N8IY74_9BURK|nr:MULTISPECIES: fumarylacetoacetase [Ramlibacter]MBA2961825.1 fumarylacetoacetase [Ramlibacter sp. CGMCC 1.13660]MVQ31767.1 fumarylacetoacetase [Ramlibacter pinisoli]
MTGLNETHDPALRSWVASANEPAGDFPIQNLPFGIFRRRGAGEPWRGGVAIGNQVLDLAAVARIAPFEGMAGRALQSASADRLNGLMALGPAAWSQLRLALSRALRQGAKEQPLLENCLVPQAQAEHEVPALVGDYTDFYTSIHHATNIGRQFRPDNPLLPNYKWVPIGYHGRSSSLGISGEAFARPQGQTMAPGAARPAVGPSRRLDIELELGIWIGAGNARGEPIPIDRAEEHVFGISLLNDWSARDIQAWEYQPLGPFLSKSFATTLSPWIVTLEALEPFRAPLERPDGDPSPLQYLDSPQVRSRGAFDIALQVELQTARMGQAGIPAASISTTNYRHAYWTAAQLVAHHTVNGCNLRPGDLFGSGTLSGPTLAQAAALIELTEAGKHPVQLPGGETRTWLEDGDTVTLRGRCERAGAARIGFGPCTGTVLPARG